MHCTLGTGRDWKRTIRLGRSLLEPWPVGGRALLPGAVLSARGDQVLRTVVGGGLLVVLMDARREVAVAAHLAVPAGPGAASGRGGEQALGLVETVLAMALRTALEQGARPGFVRAKLFGAALGVQPELVAGRELVRRVEDYLSERHLPVDEMDVGGRAYRQVAVRPSGGAVWADAIGAPPAREATAVPRAHDDLRQQPAARATPAGVADSLAG